MSSDKHCCVPGCKDSGGMHRVLHGFPNPEKDRERFNTWVYTIGSDILELENERIFKYRRVCHSHFEDKYLCRYHRLSNIAIPTLNIPGPLSPVRRRSQQRSSILKPMQLIVNPPKPSTSDPNQCTTSKDIGNEVNKENNDPYPMHCMTYTSMELLKEEHKESSGKNSSVKMNTKKEFYTKREKEMYKKIVNAKIKLCKIKNKIRRQSSHLKAAKKLASNPMALNVFENCSSTAKLLIKLQARENKKMKKGRRFTLDEKITALSIFKQSPKGYRFLRNIFILPAQQTLVKLIQKSNLQPGLNKNIFSQLKRIAEKMKVQKKLCILLFDEIALKANVDFQVRKDKITGLVDNGKERMAEFADRAQVFMVRGLIHKYKQPVYYTFAKSATKGPELAKQVKEVVTGLQEAGLIVVALVCDQGSNNRQALKLLLNETRGVYLRKGEEPKQNIILINTQEIVPLYDPPHLIKGIRNNLLTKNLKYTAGDGITKTAKWSHLQQLLRENPGYKGIRLIPKLTENHVNLEKINKMKVKFATQIFSRTVASNMGYLADKGILPTECKETADLLLFMDNIFDSVNGSYIKNKNAKPLLGPATPKSVHHKTWEEGKKIFKSMIFISSDGKNEIVPTVANWVWTLDGIQILLKKLKTDFNILSSVWLRHLNQDPLENFFGAVRSHGCRNINPTCDQFESAFATLLINNLNSVHNKGKNCEGDLCYSLHTLIINNNAETTSTSTSTFDFASIFDYEFEPIEAKESDPRKIAPIQYMSGYFLKKAKCNIFNKCDICLSDLSSTNEIEYIKYREYAGRRWLCTPSNELIKLISKMQDIINHMIKEHFELNNLKEILKTAIIILVDFSFLKCTVHKNKLVDYLCKIVINCLIYNYCKNINQILAGRRQVIDDNDDWQVKAKKNKKCLKRRCAM